MLQICSHGARPQLNKSQGVQDCFSFIYKRKADKDHVDYAPFFGNNSGNQNMHKLVQLLFYLSDDYFS